MHLGADTHAAPAADTPQYMFLDSFVTNRAKEPRKQQP
jgi:hypothetical protein